METPVFSSEEEALAARYDSGGEVSDEISPSESPPEIGASEPPPDREEFERRVTRLVEMMQEDSSVRDRILAEIYVNIASAEMGVRGIFDAVQKQGIAGMMRGAFRKGE